MNNLPSTRPHTDALDGRSPRILVIEDEQAFAEVIGELLTEEGYVVLHAADGGQALDLLARSPSLPDAIVCDVMLPGINGDEVAREARSRYPTARLPIVLLSASADPRVHLPDLTFLAKPIDIVELLNVLGRVVKQPELVGSR